MQVLEGWLGLPEPGGLQGDSDEPSHPGTHNRYPRAPEHTQTPQQTSLKLVVQKNPLQGLLKHRLLAPNPQ